MRFKDDQSRKIFEEQTRMLYMRAPAAIIGALLAAVIVCYVLWGMVPPKRILLLLAALTLISAFRLVLTLKFRKGGFVPEKAPLLFKVFVGTFFINGSIWGAGIVAILPLESPPHQTLIISTLGGMMAFVAGFYSVSLMAVAAFVVPASVPVTVYCFIIGGAAHVTIALLMLLFIVLITLLAVQNNRSVITSIRLGEAMKAEISERERVEEELRKAKERAEESTRLKDKFVTLVSHDLRSPLVSIGSFLGRLGETQDQGPETSHTRANIEHFQKTCASLIDLIDSLLDIGRLQTGEVRLCKKTIAARAMVNTIIEENSYAAREKGISLVNELPPDMRLYADPHLLGQVIWNLMSNAIKFCSKGDTITFFSPEARPRTIAVKDTGPGLDSGIVPDLFRHDVITTNIGSAGEKGKGLGLPYCQDIMKAHNGVIELVSSDAGGSMFSISLPEARTPVLVVDDQEVTRKRFADDLEELDLEVLEAEDGVEALKILRDVKPRVIITDLQMPKMDGFELLKFVREDPKLAAVPIIVVTSMDGFQTEGETTVLDRAMTLGADGFFTKPVPRETLLSEVRRLMG